MADFLLELLSEEIPARMQGKARNDLARMFAEGLAAAGLSHDGITTYSTPRRLALIAKGLPTSTEATSEEVKGPRTSAPPQALEGFLRKTGLTQDQLQDRDGVWFAVIDKPGRPTAEVIAELIPQIVRDFPWPKSMRWGAESISTASMRWVRPLHSIIALLGEAVVPVVIEGVSCGATTLGHRFHHPGVITIGSAHDYVEKLRACHVIVDQEEREAIVRIGARTLAEDAGFYLVEDEGLVVENAGLTEWPVPLLGSFDHDYLEVPEEVIQLTARINQKYFVMRGGDERLAPHFICTANIVASDGGEAIVAGNERVLAARLSDARFFWEQDLKIPLESQAKKLEQIVFHEKLGTVADKVDRVAKLARWLVEEGIVGNTLSPAGRGKGEGAPTSSSGAEPPHPNLLPAGEKEFWADQAERAARLAKADLVTGMVGEFPELQGVIGGYLARAQGEADAVANAIRDHYKPVGQGDDVPTDPVTVAVSLADKLDTLAMFFAAGLTPTGSKDPFALRRAAIGVIELLSKNNLRLKLAEILRFPPMCMVVSETLFGEPILTRDGDHSFGADDIGVYSSRWDLDDGFVQLTGRPETAVQFADISVPMVLEMVELKSSLNPLLSFFADRLKVQQREAGVRHDLIDAVFALGGEDDLVRLLARVKALQAFVETDEGTNLHAGYKRAANILKKEAWSAPSPRRGEGRDEGAQPQHSGAERPHPTLSPQGEGLEPAEAALVTALDAAEPTARAAVEAEDFTAAMAALASLRAPIDAFFDQVTVNADDPAVRARRLNLLARFRDAVNRVADFSKIEG